MAESKIILRGEDRASGVIDKINRQLVSLDASGAKLRAAFASLSPVLAGAFTGAGLAAFAKAANDGLLKIKDLSEATGASVRNVSALENVARAAGGSFDDASRVLVKFNDALRNAGSNRQIDATLKAINLDVEKLKQLDPAEALRQVAVAFGRFEDNGAKARQQAVLFGESVRQAAPFMRELAEQTELAGTVTDKAVDEADRFNKQLARLTATAENAARSIAGPLVTALNRLFGNEDRTTALERDIDGLQSLLSITVPGAEFDDLTRQINLKLAELGKLRAAAATALRPSLPEVTTPAASGAGRRTGREPKLDFRSAILDPLEEQRQAFLRTEKAYDSVDKALADLANSSREWGTAILDPLEAQKQAFLQTEKDYEGVQASLDAMQAKTLQTADVARDLGLTFSSALEDAIVSGSKLSDVLRSLERDILRIVTRDLVTQPFSDFIRGQVKGAGGPGGIFQTIGSSLASIFGGFFADGGYLQPGQIGIAGERGPELIYGGRSGLTVQPSGAGAVNVVQHFHFAAPTDHRTRLQVGAEAARGLQRAQRIL